MEYVPHYDTSSSIGIIILVCVPEAEGTATYCELSRLTSSFKHLRMPEKLATRMMHWCIDCGTQIFAASL